MLMSKKVIRKSICGFAGQKSLFVAVPKKFVHGTMTPKPSLGIELDKNGFQQSATPKSLMLPAGAQWDNSGGGTSFPIVGKAFLLETCRQTTVLALDLLYSK